MVTAATPDPPKRISAASVNRYPLVTHCRPARSVSRFSAMDGRATLSTVEFRNVTP
jgi:hypothetical protein